MARILIVDDDPDVAGILSGALAPTHEVIAARDWTQVNEHVFRKPVDLVLVDVGMPVIAGDKIAGILRRTVDRKVKIVLFSAMDEGALRRLAATAKADGYLQKNFDPVVLTAQVERLLAPAPVAPKAR